MKQDTIAAISTPTGPGAVGMVRMSGPDALKIAESIFISADPSRSLSALKGYTGVLGQLRRSDGQTVDEAVVFVYRAPKSYTGEDVVELCCHSGGYGMAEALRLCLDSGARLAQPGEFTRRAFLGGKMDLAQAEAVMDLIGAQGETALRAALSARQGRLAQQIAGLRQQLVSHSAHLAAWCDYPEEDLLPVDPADLARSLGGILGELTALLESYHQGRLLREGVSTAIVGAPNVGKSTLMNLLTGQDSSIVTSIPGTTRDVVRDTISLGGLTLHLLDTAGIRDTDDLVEQLGIDRSLAQLDTADLILAVFDRSDSLTKEDHRLLAGLNNRNAIAILNKSDLPARLEAVEIRSILPRTVTVSAHTGEGRDKLEAAILDALKMSSVDPLGAMVANERQRQCLLEAKEALAEGIEALECGVTLDAVGACIDAALDSLLSLTGERATEAVVDQVFAQFCVGK